MSKKPHNRVAFGIRSVRHRVVFQILEMKFVITFAVLLYIAYSVPLDDLRTVQILRCENDPIGFDGFNFTYETSDGPTRQEFVLKIIFENI